jgi:pimeloyl-ACP methyl ester carboxylesterase
MDSKQRGYCLVMSMLMSGGAQIGLNLAARHPTRVHTLVAHEPPCAELLPDADKLRAAMQDVYQTYRSHGVEAGMQRFQQVIGLATPRPSSPRASRLPRCWRDGRASPATWSSSSPTACGP